MESFVIGLTIAVSTALWTFVWWRVFESVGVRGKTIMLTLITVIVLNLLVTSVQHGQWIVFACVVGWILFVLVAWRRRRAPSMME